MNKIITIGRQFGSGGREVGLRLAQELGIPFYDKELVSLAAQQGELSPGILEQYEESTSIPLSLYASSGIYAMYQQPITEQIYCAQYNIIKELASKGPCVIVGRCADYILKGQTVNVFVHADLPTRIQRKVEMGIGVPPEKMKAHILATDKKRKHYYQHYTSQDWGRMENYDLCLNTSLVGIEGSVATILSYLSYLPKEEQ